MSSASIMEWNAKPTLQWDWENLIMFNATPNENPKKLRATGWELNGDKGIDSGSFNSSGGRSGSGSGSGSGSAGGSNSDLGFACFSKSSKSASNNSSSVAEVKTSMYNFEASEAIPEDFNRKNELLKDKGRSTSPTLEASVGSGEPLLSLKLGKQTYFEDVCAGSDPKASRFSVTPISSATPAKRTRSSSQGTQAPRCQVEGCNLDLSSAKDYHRKHRVCENHSKCPKVVVAGVERRFCQQCSRFHGLSEFDEKKRSCRRRLSDHNARRRKPQPGSVNLNPGRLCSSLYSTDGRQHMSFIWNKAPLVNAACNGILPSEAPSSSKFTITKEYMLNPDKIGGIDGQLLLPGSKLTNSIAMECRGSSGLLLSKPKSTTAGVLNQGLEESMVTSSVDATPDLHRALSLLSTNSWDSCDPKPAALEQPMHTNQTTMPSPTLHGMPQGFQLGSSEYWRTEQQQPADSRVHSLASNSGGNNYFQEFQPSRAPYDGDFYSSHLN